MTRSGGRAGVVLSALVITMGLVVPAQAGQAGDTSSGGAVVRTDTGLVRGEVTDTHRRFQGIPYAAPPVGKLRWRSPQPVTPWTGVKDATKPGERCAQDPGFGHPVVVNEDCLYLNVTTPRNRPGRKLKPVMVWFHGGGFIAGSGSNYDVHRLAVGGDVIVVTLNYRLGTMAYFGYPGLAGSGGYGIEDQQAALRWVQRNARAFGGDPGNVTAFGGSAGGLSVCAQLASPSAAGLFHRAILQSAPCMLDYPANALVPGLGAGSIWASRADTEAVGARLAAKRGCTDPGTAVDCLRQVSTKDLLYDEVAAELPGPTYGNQILPISPAAAQRRGLLHPVPVLAGTVRDEGRHFSALLWPEQITAQKYAELLDEAFGEDATRVAARYPVNSYSHPGLAWADVIGDRVWSCQALNGDRLFARRTAVYGFEFAERATPPWTPYPPNFPSGAYHASEVAYIMDSGEFVPALNSPQRELGAMMIRYWANFAATGDPNGPELPHWPRFRNHREQVLSLATDTYGGVRPADLGSRHNCAFWERLAAGTGQERGVR
ncbi:carboxylesterase/lipase family protein [Actinosynnema sp. ALI-1.44]|uniref:carboxylesterase/lipase family protein n=1 Tax=Actinosynnema sp. ALI-1.44 TaxID=1933779 RepID=UPI001EDBD651|nr:carboxylesterase family protein [Actinosynnema sp. ALI-1.44]